MNTILRRIWIIFLILLILVGGWSLTSYCIGWKIKHRFQYFLVTLDKNTPFTLKLINFKRGVFHSHATAEVSLAKWINNPKIKWLMQINFVHGPIVLDRVKINFVQTLADISLLYLSEKPELTPEVCAELKLSFGGRFKFRLKPKEFFSFNKSLVFSGESNFSNLILEWHLPNLALVGENQFNFKHLDFTLKGDYCPSDGLWLGNQVLKLGKLAIKESGKQWASSDFKLTTNFKKLANNFILQVENSSKQLSYNNDQFNNNSLSITLETPYREVFYDGLALIQEGKVFSVFLKKILKGAKRLMIYGSSQTPWGLGKISVAATWPERNYGVDDLKSMQLEMKLHFHRVLTLFLMDKFWGNALQNYQRWLREKKMHYDALTDMVELNLRYFDGRLLLEDIPINIDFHYAHGL